MSEFQVLSLQQQRRMCMLLTWECHDIWAALQVGDPFVLNCLGEAKYGVLMKVSCLKYSPSGAAWCLIIKSLPMLLVSKSPNALVCVLCLAGGSTH